MVYHQEIDCFRPVASSDFGQALTDLEQVARTCASPLSHVSSIIQKLTDEARTLIGAHRAVLRLPADGSWAQVLSAVSASEEFAGWNIDDSACNGFALDSLRCPITRPVRLTGDQIASLPSWSAFNTADKNQADLSGWLAVPLFNRLGKSIGFVEMTDKYVGEFAIEDERRLIHFAKVAALGIENAWLYQSTMVTANAQAMSLSLALQLELAKIFANDADLRGMLQASIEAVTHHTGVALARIWVFAAGILNLQASAGTVLTEDDGRARVPIGQFSVGHIARTRQSLLTNDLLDHPQVHDKEWSRRQGMTAFAGCPLIVEDDLMGVIALFDRKPISEQTFEALAVAAQDIALITKRHRAVDESAPLESGNRSEHAIILSSAAGTITEWNRGAEKYFGYRRDQAIGRPLDIIVPADRLDEHRDMIKRIELGEQASRSETARQHESGRWLNVRLTVSPLRNAAGVIVGAITVAHDLADIKRLQQQFCVAQKMEVFGQLAGGVAHDFNNLLTVILGYSEIMIGRLGPDDAMRELLGEIHKAGERAETLTRQLLAFNRKKLVEPRILDLNAVVADTEKMLRRLIGEDVLMTTIFSPSLRMVKIDPGQMQQIILNLAVNARDAMPHGGRLTIETANATLDEEYAIAHAPVQPGNYVMFAMTDTGVGMTAATKLRIFEPLFTTKGPGKGTGLGLTTVHGIVTRFGGYVEVHSELGRGTTFKVYLPQAEESMPTVKSQPRLPTIPRGHETVLLVEDEDSVRSLAKHVLELNGYKVLDATNGEEALRIAEMHGGPIQLLVTDVVMPHLGGRPLADRLLASHPQLRVLFLSGYTNDAVARHGVLDSDPSYLQKPFTTAALAQKVREVLDQPTS